MTAAAQPVQMGRGNGACENRSANENQKSHVGVAEAISWPRKSSLGPMAKEQERSGLKVEDSLRLWAEYDVQSEPVRCKSFGGRTERLLSKAKRNHRTDIASRDWGKFEYYKRWAKIKDSFANNNLDNISRIHGPDYTRSQFQQSFEKPAIPCVITGLADNWKARVNWDFGVSLLSMVFLCVAHYLAFDSGCGKSLGNACSSVGRTMMATP